ncbi:MAG: branched-chain amino acid ABC transporter permease [Desulfurococcales archaeon]|nr:branched-chain amino acid ABC transporter permease [Desulfurococcales archaeon]
MDAGLIIESTFRGITIGVIYSMIALGFNIVYRVNKSINFAHPVIVLMAAYVALVVSYNHSPLVAYIAAIASGIVASIAVERLVARPLLGRPPIALIGATLGVYYLVKGVTITIGGGETASLPLPYKLYRLGPINLGFNDIVALVGSLTALLVIILLHKKTRLGSAMRAVAEDVEGAAAYGIPVRRLMVLSWALAGLVGALGGIFLAVKNQVSVELEFYAIRALAASLLAGLDSMGGVIVGGIILGVAEELGGLFLDDYLPGIGYDLAFFILLLVLFVKPYGLFGTERIERV